MRPWLTAFLDIPRERWDDERAFWTAVTGWTPSAPRGETGQFVTLLPPDGDSWLKLQAIDGIGGVHLDVDCDDRAGQVAEALAAGASRGWLYHDVEVLRSPGGFAFCMTLSEPARRAVRSGAPVVDQVCLDIPAPMWEAECDFWSALTRRPLEPRRRPEFVLLDDPDGGLRILLQRLDSVDGPVRAHVDIAVGDRPAETERHVELGAQVERVDDVWTVLRAPGGRVYCLTDRDPATGRPRIQPASGR